jgi:hypothetical protein
MTKNQQELSDRTSMSVDAFLRAYWKATKPLPIHEFSKRPTEALIQQLTWKANRRTRLAPGGNAHVSVRRSKGEVYLDWIATVADGTGHGSAALDWLCNLADRHGVTLRLKIDIECRSRTSSPRFLEAWYKRHGFTVLRKIPGSGVYMTRTPARAKQKENEDA